jgi:hypothetical protein
MLVRAVRDFELDDRPIRAGQSVAVSDIEAADLIERGVAVPAGLQTRTA